ncbi:uncharacterized protein A4U43_C10F1650 [Asparagus officinalis]|uniref:Secreted protein n=1 Tax=Asparagus officinalis TaxID=4686 RepID=A0A5P1DZW4_ASPOF|nr:uncharacterized protein A4U43_C10F1650 [Asparagus officinalis]
MYLGRLLASLACSVVPFQMYGCGHAEHVYTSLPPRYFVPAASYPVPAEAYPATTFHTWTLYNSSNHCSLFTPNHRIHSLFPIFRHGENPVVSNGKIRNLTATHGSDVPPSHPITVRSKPRTLPSTNRIDIVFLFTSACGAPDRCTEKDFQYIPKVVSPVVFKPIR